MVKNDAVSLSDKVKQANSHTHTDTDTVSVTDTPADTQPKPHNDNDEIKLKLKTADDQPNKKRDTPKELKEGVVFIGHMPQGFEEDEVTKYFSQFGDVRRLRISRSVKTGKSKGYAFIQFYDKDVAQIAADAMNNYIMFRKSLKAHVVEPEKVHPKMFQGCNRKFIPRKKPEKARNALNKCTRNQKNRKQNIRIRKLAALGYEFPEMKPSEKVPTPKVSAEPSTEKLTKSFKDEASVKPNKAKSLKTVKNSAKKANKTPPAAAVDQKRVSISSSVPKIIRNSAETLSEDDEISFKTPEVSPKVTVKKKSSVKKVFPKTPLPPEPSAVKTTPLKSKSPSSDQVSSSKKAKLAQVSDASPLLKVTKQRASIASTKQTLKTPSKSPKISPRVTRSVQKKRQSIMN